MKNILITAATSDLAKALLEKAVAKGDINLITTSRKYNVRQAAPNHRHIDDIDLTDEPCLEKLARVVDSEFDGPFAIVHFAGNYWKHKPLISTSFSEIRSMMESHYLSLLGVARFLTPILLRNGGGRLLAMSCNSVAYNYPDLAPFTAAKAAIESFIKSYSNEYAEFAISATAVALPTMRTPKVLQDKTDGDNDNYIDPDEFASIVLDQLLPQSGYLTGNTIRLIKYSHTFYNKSYFERNPRLHPIK
jgi:NAD(P)-dependent dehydrogenase (short-subunit alcohol dehydrogenase family)